MNTHTREREEARRAICATTQAPTKHRARRATIMPPPISLEQLIASLAQVLSASGDSQAAQLELLHAIEQHVRTAPADDVKACQSELEKHLTTALLQGPAPPLRGLISSSFCSAFARQPSGHVQYGGDASRLDGQQGLTR